MHIQFPVALGDEVKDRVTGFQGIVVCLSVWFNRCQRATIQPPMKEKENAVQSCETFDVEQLEIVTQLKVQQKPLPQTGGPQPNAVQHAPPRQF